LLEFKFIASGGSTLAVDSFLGGPGSISDTFTVNGDISGQTKVKVNDTNSGPGVFNSAGIPVVFANSNVKGHAFFLANPIESMIAPRMLSTHQSRRLKDLSMQRGRGATAFSRKIIDIAQRNVNSVFGLATSLAGAKKLTDIVELPLRF
jgi:hypothetical protein